MRNNIRLKASLLLLLFLTEIFSPIRLLALTSGPSQPEMAAFTPAGTTEMVDPFTGDFTYNIPLMDIEGYPVNIAYNSGVTMEQEASWVGLGWNLNVGTINRSVRGLPDDFKGDEIETITNMEDMEITKFGAGVGAEIFGSHEVGKKLVPNKLGINFNAGLSFIYNNYKGFGMALDAGMGPSLSVGGLRANGKLGFSLNTLDGASLNSSLGASYDVLSDNDKSLTFGGSMGSGFNTRTGQKMKNFGTTAGYNAQESGVNDGEVYNHSGGKGTGAGVTYLPIGMETYTPYPTLKMTSTSVSFSANVGGELFGGHGNINVHGAKTTQSLVSQFDNSPAYGYLYSEAAGEEGLLDFNRDKQIELNKTTPNLSPVNFTYDVYSVSGQGVSGTFRPFRNDIGVVHDPLYKETTADSKSGGVEVGLGGIFHGGINFNLMETESAYSPWYGSTYNKYQFDGEKINTPYEKVYFKAAGELTESDIDYFNNELEGTDALAVKIDEMNTTDQMISSSGNTISSVNLKSTTKRAARAKVFSYLTADEAKHLSPYQNINSYTGSFYHLGLKTETINRESRDRKAHHLSVLTQTNPNGERFVFSIPAYNFEKTEITYNTNLEPTDGVVQTLSGEASKDNSVGKDHYYSETNTPAYAHSYLLTEKQSVDYQDITGDGVSPDDPGNAWKFNYTRTSDNYHWRVPYAGSNYMKGFETNDNDDKASYMHGKKELWYVHSIESKNQIAEFIISPRKDALAASTNINGGIPGSISTDERSYKLDKIVLYNKYDRINNKQNAVPLQTVEFTYNYSLCGDVLNNEANEGKLTLESIEVYYGGSEKGKLSPYQFSYDGSNPNYSSLNVDRWGNYKKEIDNPPGLLNEDFPYVLQNNPAADDWAAAWSLTEIITPSGGIINIEYESDDYAYVQDKHAMQMFPVIGAGSSINGHSGNSLYESGGDNNYLYIKNVFSLPTTVDLKKLFFGDEGKMDHLYFRFKMNINGIIPNEYVSGYVKPIDIGFNPYDSNEIWIKTQASNPNAISKTAWGFYRQNLFDELYNQPTVSDNNLESLLKGLAANVADIRQIFTGVERYLENRSVAKYFAAGESFIRLNNPIKSKKGGGVRVASVVLNDNWMAMAGEGAEATYGQTYEYTTEENGQIISSGVASYEPMIGNDENPFRQPNSYIAMGASGHIPAISAYQEEPLGETFFPSPTVGYSKVKVKSIHAGKGKTSNLITEHSFYTAKDYPVIVKKTSLSGSQKYNSPSTKPGMTFPFSSQTNRSEFAASQGFSIILNDMHGKPLSTESYTLQVDPLDSEKIYKKIVSGTKYNYHEDVQADGRKILKNEVNVLSADGSMGEKLLGVEYDVVIDSRRSFEKTSTRSDKGNLDVIPAGGFLPFPIPIPTYFTNSITDIKEAKTMVVTKVIQMYGIVKSVESYTDQYATTAYNELYNGTTGEVLLTKTEDEYNADEFQFSVPAYLTPDLQRMGPAVYNSMFTTEIEESYDANCSSGTGYYHNPGYLKHGDEVLITPETGAPYRAWVDLNFQDIQITPEVNGKDPYILMNDNCEPYWEFAICGEIYYSDCGGTAVVDGDYDLNMIIDNLSREVELYLPKKEIINFFLNPPFNDHKENNLSFCQEFSGANCKFLESHVGNHLLHGFSNLDRTNQYGLLNLFNLSSSVSATFKQESQDYCLVLQIADSELSINDTLKRLLLNEGGDGPLYSAPSGKQGVSSIFLVRTILGGENVFFMLAYKKDDLFTVTPVGGDDYMIKNPTINNTLPNSFEPPTCRNTFRLKNNSGSYITTTEGDQLKVIRSGNRNMLTTHEGSVLSNEYPIETENGKFKRIKPHNQIQITQASAQKFSEECELQPAYGEVGGPYNKFLSGADGSFKVEQTYRYLARRHQNASGVESAKDGYFDALPPLWEAIEEDCYFMLESPIQGDEHPEWIPDETITLYDEKGNSLEAKNALDIYSSVLINPFGKVEATATNAKQNSIVVESFENYGITYAGRVGDSQKNISSLLVGYFMPPDPPSYSLRGVNYYEPIIWVYNGSHLLVNEVAHTGNYSIFLKGENPNPNEGIVLPYSEEALDPLAQFHIADQSYSQPQTYESTNTQYENARGDYENDFKSQLRNTSEFDNAILNGVNELQLKIDPKTVTPPQYSNNSGWEPVSGKTYYLSVWMKEISPTHLPFHGVSPKVILEADNGTTVNSIGTFDINSENIDGWYQIGGEFTYPSGDPDVYLNLNGGLWGAFFDDLRIMPVESNMQTYVYDRKTGRLKAQLDENNYATFYEYDEEGVPTQVKKETAAGVLTISESRQSKFNHPNQ